MAISEQVEVDVTGLGTLDDLAGLLDKAAESAGKLKDELASMGGGAVSSAGADKFAAAWDAAAGKVSASVDKISAAMGKLDDLGAGAGAAGPDKLVASWDDAAASIGASVDKIAASGAKLDDLGAGAAGAAGPVGDLGKALNDTAAGADRLGGASAPAADGIKGIGDSSTGAAAQLAALRAEMAATAAENDKLMAGLAASADTTVAVGKASATYAAALPSLGTTSIEQDAAVAQAQQARTAAAQQAKADAADAEASASRYHMLALGGAAALGYGVYKAAQLQTSVTRLYTTAGESAANLPMMSQGILKLSGETNTSQAQLGQGAYMAESAGFHGQSALNVLKAAAEGAQAEGAPLSDTTNALTSLLNAYGMKGKNAPMQAMDEIISMVSRGKMTMSGAVGALPDVLPAASAAKLSFADVGGALSTMTSMGVSPDRAAQNLSHVITSIMNPSNVQTKEQQQLGLNPVQIQNDLGKQGLTGTLTELSSTVMKNMGPAGDVLFKSFNQSQSAAADANKMISAMPASIRGLAQSYADGKTSAAQWNQEMFKGSESGLQKNMLQQFATTENQAKGFNELLKSGSPDVQTYAAAMDKLLGGQTGLNVAMELTGQHMPVMKANTDAIAQSAKHAGDNVTGWSKVQQSLNFQLGSFDKTAQAVATEAGQVALPAITGVLKAASTVGGFLASHPAVTKPLVEVGGALAAAAIIPKVASVGATALSSVGKVAETLNIPGLDKLANIGKGNAGDATAAAGVDRLGASADRAAASLDRVGAAGDKAAAGEDAAGAAGDKAATGESALGGAGTAAASGLKAALGPAALGVILGEFVRSIGDTVAPAGTPAGKYNQMLQQQAAKGGPASQLHPYTLGGFEGWAMQHVGEPVGNFINRGLSQASQMVTDPFDAIFGTGHKAATAPGKTSGASASFNTAIAQAMGKPVKLAPPDISSLTAAKGKAESDAKGIWTSVDTALSKPVKAAAPDLSAYTAARGKAAADGAQIDAGLASGIAANSGAAVSAAQNVASQVEAAMKKALEVSSPSKVTTKIGASAVDGLIAGLEGGQAAVTAASQALGKQVAKAADVTSIDSAITKGIADAGTDSGLVKFLKADQSKLLALSAQRTKLETEITDSQQIATQAIANSNITSAGTYTPVLAASDGPLAASSTVTGMQQMAADQAQFAKVIGQLGKQGLNATSLNQFTQAGTSSLPQALGLEQGGKGAISQVNAAESQIQASAAKLGDVGGTAMYAAGVQAGQGLAAGIKSSLSSVEAAISGMAKDITSTIKKDLKISSPSQVFAEIGMALPQGAAMGVNAGSGLAEAAVARMGQRMTSAYHPGYSGHSGGFGGGGSGGGGGGGDTHITVNMSVMGSVMSEGDLVGKVQKGLLNLGLTNWRAGVVPQGRAA